MSYLQRLKQIIQNYLLSFLELQFVISLMSLPILIIWGIPISLMSPLANFIFTPLMILFLWISCLASICIIIKIPCYFFEIILNKLTIIWLYLLSFSHPTWLIGFPIKTIYISVIICLSIICWYLFTTKNPKLTFLFLSLCWLTIILTQHLLTSKNQLKQIGSLPLWTFNAANKTYLIDNGALCTRKNIFTHLDYTILPELIYHTGFTTIDAIIFYKPSTQITKIAEQCITQLNCKTFIVTQKGHCYQNMQKYFLNKNIVILPLFHKKKLPPKNCYNIF
ncbi:hypothetical protein HYV10_00735 [Candidatus Dependentiae bacterium]|nr:hypothetical protein [Candidatus Dependentiae bacterium]